MLPLIGAVAFCMVAVATIHFCGKKKRPSGVTSMTWIKNYQRADLGPGVVFLKTDGAVALLSSGLHKLEGPVVLVSGDLDDPALLPDASVLDSPNLVRWFAQNLHTDHPKAVALPLGVDYHSIEENARPDWGRRSSHLSQEKVLMELRRKDLPRARKVLLNFTLATNPAARGACTEALKDSPLARSLPVGTPREAVWNAMLRASFMACPDGTGVDTHRLWEALALRCIPIVTRPPPPMERLYRTLPIAIVDSWDEVTEENLASWEEEHRQAPGSPIPAPATFAHWKRQIQIR